MAAFTDLDPGAAPNNGLGTTLRAGALIINANNALAANKSVDNTYLGIETITGGSNTQGLAQNRKFAQHYPVVSLGTKLIIPFISQAGLNSTSIVRIIGHSAKNNSNVPLGFTIDFNLGHLTTISNFAVLNSSGNYASAAVNGMNIEITFTANYTSVTADGVFITLDYMTNNTGDSIDIDNIAMN